MRTIKAISIIFFAVILAACSPAAQTATLPPGPTVGGGTPVPFFPPTTLTPQAELFRASGTGPGSSQPFTIDRAMRARVNWRQFSQDAFRLAIASTDPAQTDPMYQRVVVAFSIGPSEGYNDVAFVPGQYQVVIEEGDGAWEVWIQALEANQ